VQCPEQASVDAYFDEQIDVVAAADIERHIDSCPSCQAHYQDLKQLQTELRRAVPLLQAPATLRAQVLKALDRESPPSTPRVSGRYLGALATRTFWLGAASGLGTAAAAAIIAFLFLKPLSPASVADELLSAHLSSLMSTHLVDVVSTDQHTVKPWFAGHTDVSPLVADFEQQGYKLLGGRVDYLAHQRAAVVIYQHGPHVINVFSWSAGSQSFPDKTTRNGYHMIFWKAGDLDYCAVSDTSWGELLGLTQLLKDLGARDAQ